MKTKILTIVLLLMSIIVTKAQINTYELLGRTNMSVSYTIDPITGHKTAYLFGGDNFIFYSGSFQCINKKDLYKYDTETMVLTRIENSTGELPPNIKYHKSSFFDGKIFIYGGQRFDDNNNVLQDDAIYIFDIANNNWSKNDISPNGVSRSNMAVVQEGSKMHLIGGKNTDGTLSNEYQIFDMSTNTITQKTSINMGGREGASVIKDDNNLYLIGGKTEYGVSGDILAYNLVNNFWSMSGIAGIFFPSYEAMASDLYGGAAILYIWGGLTSGSKGKTSNEEVISTSLFKIYINTQNNQLQSEELRNDLPPLTSGAAWVDIDENDTVIYALGGFSNITSTGDTTVSNNFYRYNITNDLVQQYDTVQLTWGEVQSSINETEFDKNANLNVYPNPATNEISFSIPSAESITSIKIFNQNGQLVKQINKPENSIVNISGLNSGLYFIRIDTEAYRYLSKVIKN